MAAPVALFARPAVRLVLTSAALLFTELALLRWVPANVVFVGFFSNYLLMASFLGIGLGILLGRRFGDARWSPFAALLAATIAFVLNAQLNVQLRSEDEIFFGLFENRNGLANFLVLPLVFVLVTAIMAALALPLGRLLRATSPLRAYALDITGSLAGIVLFVGLSALSTPPAVWFAALALLLLLLALGRGLTRGSVVNGALLVGVVGMNLIAAGPTERWSPYYRITLNTSPAGEETIDVNGIPHQTMHAADTAINGDPSFYEQVFRWFPSRRFARALIVGAGSGSDVAVALARGVERVDAVEIDPGILAIGASRHPDHPYDDRRVRAFVNDGRAFLRTSTDRYDLIVFALPDSLVLMSPNANLRLESFLFTDEAFQSVKDHLTPDGVFVLYNYYREPWLLAKIGSMLEQTYGAPPLVRTFPEFGYGTGAVLAGRTPEAIALGPAAVGSGELDLSNAPAPATDDWPLLYLRARGIASHYFVMIAFILLVAGFSTFRATRIAGISLRAFSPHFFLLGAAFLLLETRSLVTFGLLFGTTWIVNALVFFAILLSVLAAIGVNAWRAPRPRLLYSGLAVALLVAYLLPPSALLLDPPGLRYLVATIVAFAPVFFANLVFSSSFRDTKVADMAFASNLLGAMVGGVIEYGALITGYQALLLVVALLYAAAYLFGARFRVFADRELVGRGDLVRSSISQA
ncbi:MAG TPA: spermidine synthase [Candidatus Limnocylindria bacterium]|nr:spermidine synthase [Candidatus Limnocylindria bacterium]